MVIEPHARDPLELAEQVQPRFLARIAPLGLEQPLCQVEQQRRPPQIARVDQAEVHPLADDPLVARDGRTDDFGRQLQRRVAAELRRQPLLRQLDAVALHARETNLAGVALRRDRPDQHRLARLLRLDRHGRGGEVEGDAEHVRVLDVEAPVRVGVVRLAAERAADDLLAEELRPEGANPSTCVTVRASQPSVSIETETTQRIGPAERVRLADGVHHLPEQILVGELLGLPAVASPLDDLPPEALDLVAGRGPEVLVERLARVELLAVDEQRARPRQRVAVLVEVRNSARRPFSSEVDPSSFSRWNPEM